MDNLSNELPFHLWLSEVYIKDESKIKLLTYFGEPSKLFFAKDEELKALLEVGFISDKEVEKLLIAKKQSDIYSPYLAMTKKGIRILPLCSPEYPKKLKNIPGPPAYLFVDGLLPQADKKYVAIIGTRVASSYGRKAAEYFGFELARRGIGIISGMARGIDGLAQRAAIRAGGQSFGILGCGVDICYPLQNRDLYDSLKEKGGLISPFAPGTKPQPYLFPERNRIISGLSDAVLVAEARLKSGSKITVDFALEQGRDVFAVPGRITDPMSTGTNDLIKQGASIADSVDTVLEALLEEDFARGLTPAERTERALEMLRDELPHEQFEIVSVLDDMPKSLDDIYKEARKENRNLTVGRLRSLLTELCIDGYVTDEGGGFARCF
ncbi:MAG: DNA-processing protein DprA [Lachnospiraceae bacterium]|nr:DNA-processing protein DprA [Lachnospiraceae bacterium]